MEISVQNIYANGCKLGINLDRNSFIMLTENFTLSEAFGLDTDNKLYSCLIQFLRTKSNKQSECRMTE
jgi:hypothetical protein